MFVTAQLHKRISLVEMNNAINPWPNGKISNCHFAIASNIFVILELLIQYIQLSFGFHRVTVNGIFVMDGSITVKVSKSSPQQWRRANIPKEPIECFYAAARVFGEEGIIILFRQVFENISGFKDSKGWIEGNIEHGWYFGVGVDNINEFRSELIEIKHINLPRIVLDSFEIIEFFQKDRDLHSVGRPDGVQLCVVFASRESLGESWTSGRFVHGPHFTILISVKRPNIRAHIIAGKGRFRRLVWSRHRGVLIRCCCCILGRHVVVAVGEKSGNGNQRRYPHFVF
mmetsp:Transcript_31572/g.52124  ORF Transcript_31572/g.52124 Transcript_31572/m.52124 type:complete len:285 (-) Transcript_31572:37-891(-)